MTPETIQSIRAHALAEYPNEACGLVVNVRGNECYITCRNVAETPSEHFRMHARDYADADDAGEILYIVHSHPDVPARASEGDKVACEASGLPWYIVSVLKDAQGCPQIAGDAIL